MGDIEIMAEAPPPAPADDIGDGAQCTDHPYRSNPGGICAFCLQEKLGKLVSSSSAASSSSFLFLRPQPSSSSSPSFRSTSSSSAAAATAAQTIAPKKKSISSSDGVKKTAALNSSNNVSVLKRSKSVAPASVDSPRKKSFWSFLYLNSSSNKRRSTSSVAGESAGDRDLKQSEEKRDAKTLESEAESPGSGSHVSSSSFSRKVARSRSVGCGSRSFSGDFLERISTGFGDCTLRRVESHRESNSKAAAAVHHRQQLDRDSEQRITERVKCGGIFGGFGMISSSSSTYWLSAATAAAVAGDDGDDFDTRRSNTARASTSMVRDSRSRNRNWAWAFASPMRAFKPATASKSYELRNAVSRVNGAGNGNGKAVNGGSGADTRKVGANPSLLAAH